jgi:hypothetical protein
MDDGQISGCVRAMLNTKCNMDAQKASPYYTVLVHMICRNIHLFSAGQRAASIRQLQGSNDKKCKL